MDLIETVAGSDYFDIGIDGTVFIKNYSTVTYGDVKNNDYPLNFSSSIKTSALNVIISEFTPNSILQQAYR